jgi:hypothetical protein
MTSGATGATKTVWTSLFARASLSKHPKVAKSVQRNKTSGREVKFLYSRLTNSSRIIPPLSTFAGDVQRKVSGMGSGDVNLKATRDAMLTSTLQMATDIVIARQPNGQETAPRRMLVMVGKGGDLVISLMQ